MRQTGIGTRLGPRRWWIACGTLFLLALSGLQASPLKSPRRLVNGQLVQLNPLFTWWTNHTGVRPLSAWVHLIGPVTSTNTLGWVIEARVESTGLHSKTSAAEGVRDERTKVVLQRPPLDDLAEFERLTGELKDLNQQRANLSSQEKQAKAQSQAIGQQRGQTRYNRASSRLLDQEDRQLKQLEQQENNQLKLLDQRIQSLKSRLATFPSSDRYEVDCFALDEGRDFDQMHLYDHGMAYP